MVKQKSTLIRLQTQEQQDVWRKARSKAIMEGKNLKDVILQLLRKYIGE